MRVALTLLLLAPAVASAQDAAPDAPLPDLGGGGPCGAITIKGCCDGDILRFCQAGQVSVKRCAPGSCGWDASGNFYGCDTPGGADPTGRTPRSCPAPAAADVGADALDADALDADGATSGDAPSDLERETSPLDLGADGPADAIGDVPPLADSSASAEGGSTSGSGGCGCTASTGAGAPPVTLLLLLLLALIGRRRRLLP